MEVSTSNSVVNSSNIVLDTTRLGSIFLALLTSGIDKTNYFLADTEFFYIILLYIQHIDCWGFSGVFLFVCLFLLSSAGLIFASY